MHSLKWLVLLQAMRVPPELRRPHGGIIRDSHLRMSDFRAPVAVRAAAFVAGTLVLLVAAVSSLGFALAAPLGMWIAHRVQRAHERTVGGWDSWLVAMTAMLIAVLLVGGVFAAKQPPGTWSRVISTADSVSAEAAGRSPPAWVTRLVPTASRASVGPVHSQTVNTALLMWGFAMGIAIAGALIASAGWAGTMLLVFSVTGRWFRAPAESLERDAKSPAC